MLGHAAIGDGALLSIPAGTATPYTVEIDDSAEIDVVTLVILSPYIDPEVEA